VRIRRLRRHESGAFGAMMILTLRTACDSEAGQSPASRRLKRSKGASPRVNCS
jgi:hypothetical protein